MRRLFAAAAVAATIVALLAALPAQARETQRLYLSGTDKDKTVPWEFFCTAGRNSGKWATIPVPAHWEFHGFGTYSYGRDPKPDPAKGIGQPEQGRYRHTFKAPADFAGQRVFLVFEGSMTDTEAKLNGRPVGDVHRGSFYRFKYEVTDALKLGQDNLLEVNVAKFSADETVNRAERQSDYWLFGGIYRPVYLEAVPKTFIDRVAIDARADGSFAADVFVNGLDKDASVEATLTAVGPNAAPDNAPAPSAALKAGDVKARLEAKRGEVRTWTAETPHLYEARFILRQGGAVVHEVRQRFGYRTVEVRPGDGLYVNGKRVLLKGANRHSFWPDSGRCLSRAVHEADIKVLKDMNMNAVRMSHYPPDVEFLDLCDELGLYVLDELGGWQKSYGTPVGKKLVEALVTRDVNHPGILLWDNGNEGGWNTELDGEFAKWDPQGRKVMHPWSPHDGINTKHYPRWTELQKLAAGPELFMPTEFLHALYDGGGGAGLAEYWEAIRTSKVGVGAFHWALVDEAAKRVDMDGFLDAHGTNGPDGLVGPYREREGSFYAVKEIWSPVVATLKPTRGDLPAEVVLDNRYDFTNLDRCTFTWQLRKFHRPGDAQAGFTVVSEGTLKAPSIDPGQSKAVPLDLPKTATGYHVLALRAADPTGRELWTWVWPIRPAVAELIGQQGGSKAAAKEDNGVITLSANDVVARIDARTGLLLGVTAAGKPIPLSNGPRVAVGESTATKVERREDGASQVIDVTGAGNMPSFRWTLSPAGELRLDYEYTATGNHPYLGVTFDFPEDQVKSCRWLGAGPYRVWKNRLAGTTVNVWENTPNDTVTGQTWQYPEFKGYFADFQWARLTTGAGAFTVATETPALYFRLLTPRFLLADAPGAASRPVVHPPGRKRLQTDDIAVPFPPGNLSFLHAIGPIGNKFQAAKDTGPAGQPNKAADAPYRGTLFFLFK